MCQVVKGVEVSTKLVDNIRTRVKRLNEKEVFPCVAIVRVGDARDAIAYEKGATKKMQSVDISVKNVIMDANTSQEMFDLKLEELNNSKDIHGILILQPLPDQICENTIKMNINPQKDIDAISPINFYKIIDADPSGFVPCTAEAVIRILDYLNIDLTGKKVVVIGRSLVVGKPLSLLLSNRDATVTSCHSRTKNLAKECREADILIAAVGSSELIKDDFISNNTGVVDVGINVSEDGIISGDVDFENVKSKTSFITPVPGGVGSVTTTILAEHVIKAAEFSID